MMTNLTEENKVLRKNYKTVEDQLLNVQTCLAKLRAQNQSQETFLVKLGKVVDKVAEVTGATKSGNCMWPIETIEEFDAFDKELKLNPGSEARLVSFTSFPHYLPYYTILPPGIK